ncbi:MAG: hypothetical protein ABEJ26_09590 [Halosimplex sp.]
MTDTGGDWTRRHARLGGDGVRETADRAEARTSGDGEGGIVRAAPPDDDWRARHAWCRRT